MKYHHYLKIFFSFLLIQNVLIVAGDSISVSSALSPTDSSLLNELLSGKNATDSIGLDNTFNNSTLLNATTPVLLNCTDAINNNSTDLSKCTPLNITTSLECTKVNYDFAIYTTNWQPKNCYSRNCDRPYETPKWRISGLRGSFMNGTRPVQCCSDRQLKLNDLNSLLPELKENWVYEKDSNVSDSLVEEWNLHGSCVQEAESKTNWELFAKTLSLAKKFPIEQWLSNAKIEPSNDKKYGFQFFNHTITSNVNKRIQIRCKTFDYDKRISIIDSVNFCLDKITTDVIDCPSNFESNCLEMVYYNTHLLDYKVSDEILYRDMNYYQYRNYHSSYSPFMTGHYRSSSSLSPFASGALTGAALAALPATALAVPATYYYFKNKNKYNKMKYGGGGSFNSMPWYASSAFSNTFAPTPNFNSYGSKPNFNYLPGGNNLYPRQNNYFSPPPASVWSGVQGNKNFGNLNTPDLSPNFYNRNGNPSSGLYPSYPKYPSSGNYPNYPPPSYSANNPSYPSHSSGNNPSYPSYSANNPSYPAYPKSSNLPPQPPSYSDINKNTGGYYPKEAPPKYSEIDKNKAYPSYPGSNKPSAPSLSELDKGKSGSGLYPKLPNDLNGKHSPSAPSLSELDKGKSSYPSYGSSSSNSKPSYPSYGSSSSNSKPSSSATKPKSSGGFFGNLFNKMSGRSSGSGSSNGRSSGSRSSGSRFGGSRSGGGRSRG